MASVLRSPGAYNGYMPQETGQLVAFMLAHKEDFPVLEYCQLVPAKKPTGVYRVLERDEMVRVVTEEEDAWAPGDLEPDSDDHQVRTKLLGFRTQRHRKGWRLDYETIENSDYAVKPIQLQSCLSRTMTSLTNRIATLLNTVGNWGTSYGTANALNGGKGKWSTASADESSPYYMAILKTLQASYRDIHLATNGAVKMADLLFIVNPDAAIAISQTDEINAYCKNSSYAKTVLEVGLDPQYDAFGLPSRYRGFKFLVESAPIVTERAKASGVEATTARRYIKGPTTCWAVSRKGGLTGVEGSPTFSTVQIYHYGPLTKVQAFDRPRHELVQGRIVTHTDEIMAAAVAGKLIQDIL